MLGLLSKSSSASKIMIKFTSRYSRNEDILEFISTNHRIGIEIACCGDEAREDIICNIVECLLFLFVGVHVEGITEFSHEYSSAT